MAEVLRRIDLTTTALVAGVYLGQEILPEQSFWYKNVTINAKHFDPAALPLAVGVIGFLTRKPPLDKMLIIGLAEAIRDTYKAFVAKKPFVVAKDASTLNIENFDASSAVSVVIDGKPVSFTTAPTTDANGKAAITLPSAMTSGTHKVVVYTAGGASWAGIVVV